MVALTYGVVLLLATGGGPALSGIPFHLSISYQTCVLAPLPEVHAPGDPGPDIPSPDNAQRLCKNDVVKAEGYLGVPAP